MNTEFNWWLLIVGLTVGAGLVWLILSITRRDEADVTDRERESEARWIGDAMRKAGRTIDDVDALDILRLHEAYLAAPPPDDVDAELEPVSEPSAPGVRTFSAPDRSGRSAAADAHPPMAHRIGAPEPVEPGRGDR
ncbi:MAG TPA: hypothetical protein VFJ71_10495 [Candidatus Limnocylindrales bacterium]|nr:hypothetical protein [Candidatus Limnocylindrales bacterium]